MENLTQKICVTLNIGMHQKFLKLDFNSRNHIDYFFWKISYFGLSLINFLWGGAEQIQFSIFPSSLGDLIFKEPNY